jgi:two-component system chemotaxis response regulator CheB
MSVRRDVVVIGASAGGLDAVSDLLAQLPHDLGAAVCVVVHVAPDARGGHAHVLDRASALQVRLATDLGGLYHGNVYVAPPDHHLVLGPGHLRVARGPKENRSRPAIDPLFRSAADLYGARVIGVLLTGYLDDGVAGLAAIQRAGGLTIVQDPTEARAPDMPSAALARVDVDRVVPLHRMGALVAAAVGTGNSEEGNVEAGGSAGLETRIAGGEEVSMDAQERLGKQAGLGCPECGGPLLRVNDPDIARYRCHIGHAYTERALLSEQSEQVERALAAALRTLEERGRLLDDLARAQGGGNGDAASLHERASDARRHAETLRALVLGGAGKDLAV